MKITVGKITYEVTGKVLGIENGIASVLVAIGDDIQIVTVPVGHPIKLNLSPKKESTGENPQV